MRFLRDSLTTLISLGGTFLLGIISSVLTARLLGVEGKGILTLVFLLPSLCVSLTGLGQGSATAYFLRRREVAAGPLFANSILVALVATVVSVAGVLALWPWLGHRVVPGVSAEMAALGMARVPLALVADFALYLLLGSQQVVRMNAASLAGQVSSIGMLVVALLVFQVGVRGAIIASLLGAVASLVIVLRAVRETLGRDALRFRPDLRALTNSISYGAREHLGNLAMFLAYRVDVFFVAAYGGAKAVGIYAIAVMLAEMFFYLPHAVSTALFPRVTGDAAGDAAQVTARTVRMASGIVWVGALISLPLVEPVIRLGFSDAFVPAATAFFALLPGVYAMSLSKVMSPYFTGTLGQPGIVARTALVAVAINIPLNFVLIPRFGIVGAAAASSVAYVAHAAVSLFIFRRHSGISFSEILFPRQEDVAWVAASLPALRPSALAARLATARLRAQGRRANA